MYYTLSSVMTVNTKHLWIELNPETQAAAWRRVQHYSNDASRWNAYVNYLCLHGFIEWINQQPDLPDAGLTFPTEGELPRSWEFTNGSSIAVGEHRLVLIPSESTDIETLCVPQEWVDIPNWVGDYYLAVQMKLEDDRCWMRFWGFATYNQIQQGEYHSIQRYYSLNREALWESMNVLWVGREVCPEGKPQVSDLPELNRDRVRHLLEQLGEPTSYSPRLEVPFAQWGALLGNPEWQNELFLRRVGEWQPLLNINYWAQMTAQAIAELQAAGWQLYEDIFPNNSVNYGWRLMTSESVEESRVVKRIELATPSRTYEVALIITLEKEPNGMTWILPQLRPVSDRDDGDYLPEGIQLMVIDDEGEIFERVIASEESEGIHFAEPFCAEPGTQFTLEVALGEVAAIYSFEG
ncbi:DUF1822 family protein [Phormidium sp. CCY1219]|uniref:DUF1822 family protein n=1 Tax=Phormidium sp. CCY1219 TaxID=2886104 RepID=UPI002D1EA67E|nr:DUF1822 family protein [Phormidium sp. CCY1219]MEB3829441.1 DUF1822 family protein [Phormidium sp. CCY1219]